MNGAYLLPLTKCILLLLTCQVNFDQVKSYMAVYVLVLLLPVCCSGWMHQAAGFFHLLKFVLMACAMVKCKIV
jgi:hypothetical protein